MATGELPSEVKIREVGPRDGFQNEPDVIPTADKVRLIDMLAATGLRRIEVTSFVRPDVIPQLSDADEVLRGITRPDGVSYSVLIPNERGLERALALRDRFNEVDLFLSASETHNQKNVNRSIADSLTGLEATIARARAEGLRCEGVISVSFGCPYEGEVPPERVFAIAERLAAAGCEEIGFGDTTGMANPAQVGEFLTAARERLPGVELTAHFHNTRGQGLANVFAALEAGITSFESAFGELGGCPVPPGSTGNISTEDLVSMLDEMGIATGIDLVAAPRRVTRGPGAARPPARRARAAGGAGGLALRRPARQDLRRIIAPSGRMRTRERKYRRRTWLRSRLPWGLNWLAPKGGGDCGAHEWYREELGEWRCLHCTVGVAMGPPPGNPEEVVVNSALAIRVLVETSRRRELGDGERELLSTLTRELLGSLDELEDVAASRNGPQVIQQPDA